MQEPVVQFVIPMAGAGSRFQKAGYKLPKPLIPVLGKPMIQLVVENLTPKKYQAKFVFLVQQAHIERYHVDQLLQRVAPGCGIVPLHGSPRSRSFGCEPTARDRQLRPVRGLLDGRVL